MTDIFPITDREHDVLIAMGYMSGLGWEWNHDYQHKTWGVIWNEMSPAQVSEFKTDLLNVRRWLAEADHRERCEAAALQMYEALRAVEWIEYRNWDGRHCPVCMLDQETGHKLDCALLKALAAAEGG